MGKGCAVDGCGMSAADEGVDARRFRFPRDEVRCKLWVERCRNKVLLTWDSEKLHRLRRVCGRHFAPHAFVNSLKQRLVHDAVPSIFQYNMSGQPKEPMVWTPNKRVIMPDVKTSRSMVVPNSLPQPRNILLPKNPQENIINLETGTECTSPNLKSLKSSGNSDLQVCPAVKQSIEPSTIVDCEILDDPSSANAKQTTTEISNIPRQRDSEELEPLLIAPSGSEHDEITNLMDLEPNIWEKHMELFQQSEGKEFLIVGEVCMVAEKDPNQMCGSAKCNDDLYSSKRAEQLVRCWSRCKKWFHRRCTDLTFEEYRVLSNKESLRWLCEECRKEDIF